MRCTLVSNLNRIIQRRPHSVLNKHTWGNRSLGSQSCNELPGPGPALSTGPSVPHLISEAGSYNLIEARPFPCKYHLASLLRSPRIGPCHLLAAGWPQVYLAIVSPSSFSLGALLVLLRSGEYPVQPPSWCLLHLRTFIQFFFFFAAFITFVALPCPTTDVLQGPALWVTIKPRWLVLTCSHITRTCVSYFATIPPLLHLRFFLRMLKSHSDV